MAVLHLHLYLSALGCWVTQLSSSLLLPNATELLSPPGGTAAGLLWGEGVPRGRRRRHLSAHDMGVILDYHNQVRAQVSPPAANMEYMVWDERLARAAEAWAARCLWDHGPPELMKYVGQNLSIQSGSRLGCALGTCANVRVWGSTWRHAILLVCNYAIKGNWLGEAPYKVGRPCSACPPSYGGGCSNNMCFTGVKSNQVSWF
ncbi:Peptidase inhibitor R3HDML [Turdus rufiventris]|nr:Peptidase inhibitor R3HDML [Turdus rufiventris]